MSHGSSFPPARTSNHLEEKWWPSWLSVDNHDKMKLVWLSRSLILVPLTFPWLSPSAILSLIITISDTSKNQPKRLYSHNHINLSRLIGTRIVWRHWLKLRLRKDIQEKSDFDDMKFQRYNEFTTVLKILQHSHQNHVSFQRWNCSWQHHVYWEAWGVRAVGRGYKRQ